MSQAVKPTTWRKMKLGEIVVPKGSVSGPFGSNIHSKFFTRDGVPVIRGNNLTIGFNTGRYIDDDYIFLSEKKAEELSKSEALPEDIIVTARGTIGQTGIIPKKSRYKKYILSANQLRFRIDRQIANPLFVYYWLASKVMVRMMQNVSVNVGVPNLNLGNTRNLLVPLPPVPVQERIADILSAFDDKIELNNKISKNLEQMAQAIFKEWFIEKSKIINQNAKLWEEKRLGEIMQFEYGKALKAEERKAGNIPVVGSSGIVGTHNQKLVTGPGIVVGRKGTVGNIIWLDTDFYPIDTTFYVVSGLSLYFCFFMLKRQKFITGDSAVPGLNRNSALSHEIVVPPKELIDKFEGRVKPLFQKIHNIKAENQKLAAFRDLLLPKLMSGKIRV